jgi:hypothetical protein
MLLHRVLFAGTEQSQERLCERRHFVSMDATAFSRPQHPNTEVMITRSG